jgi:hypothetical protein
VELSGFALRTQPSIGVLDCLYARALYLVDEGCKLLWLHCDLIGLDARIVATFRAWAERQLGLSRAEVMLSATHTHSGPCTINLAEAGSYDESYVDWLLFHLQEAAQMAMRRTEPCSVVTGEAEFGLAIDRRQSATPRLDPRLGVIGLKRTDGTYAGVIANAAIHPVALGPGNRRISGDLHGLAADYVGRQLQGSPVVFMTNGACGNLNPPALDVSRDQLESWSREIAHVTVGALHAATPTTASLRVAVAEHNLNLDTLDRGGIDAHVAKITRDDASDPVWNARLRRAAHQWRHALVSALERGQPATRRETELFAVAIGGVVFVGVNAEVFPDFTAWLRRATGLAVYTLGYANGNFGYLCPNDAYDEGGYEVETAHVFYGGYRIRAGELERLAQEAAALVRTRLGSGDGAQADLYIRRSAPLVKP